MAGRAGKVIETVQAHMAGAAARVAAPVAVAVMIAGAVNTTLHALFASMCLQMCHPSRVFSMVLSYRKETTQRSAEGFRGV